jgi:hypothetical protein
MARAGVTFAEENPVTHLMVDKATGKINPELYNEKVLSAMAEGMITLDEIPAVIKELRAVSPEIDTVFSLDLIDGVAPDGSVPAEKVLKELGVPVYINGKNNLGLGRPLA